MNRFRLGLTGLAFVFLVVMIAAAGIGPFGDGNAQKTKEETLATLGVTPGAEGSAAEPSVPEKPPLETQQPAETLSIDEDEDLTEI